MAVRRRRRSSFPRMTTLFAISLTSVLFCSKATDSKGSTLLQTTSLKLTSESASASCMSSACARKRRLPTSSFMREASACVYSSHLIWLCTVSSRWERTMPILARITVRGVFSSWEASATNCRCCRHDFSMGRSAHRARNRLMPKKASKPKNPTSAEASRREVRLSISLVRSAKAMRLSWMRKRRFSPRTVPEGLPCASTVATIASSAASLVTVTFSPKTFLTVLSALSST